ncbi:MAG: alpha-1,2-fucosyltransferase [Hyphomicrobiaceae bacterium]
MSVVYVRLSGGLGNQLFQYAAARALALRKGCGLRLDITSFEACPLRRYALSNYAISQTIATTRELSIVADATIATPSIGPVGLLSNWFPRKKKFVSNVGNVPNVRSVRYNEPHYHFDAQLDRQETPIHMVGYWQSERYFSDAVDTLRCELVPKLPLDDANGEIAGQIARSNAISLHVRRGDYVTNAAANAFHGVCSIDYFHRGIGHIVERTSDPRVFLFSDDIGWAQTHIDLGVPTTFVAVNQPCRGFRDIQLMSMCRHHVISNSTFGWWGAWLNPIQDKIVVAPRRWFVHDDWNTCDLIPAGWMRL